MKRRPSDNDPGFRSARCSRLAQWVAVGTALFFILICPFTPAVAGSEKELTVCLPVYPDTLDPTMHRSRVTQLVIRNIYESLTIREGRSEPSPGLAESWEMLDPLTWEFHLKTGIRFHNGDAFTARDVKATFDRVLSVESPRRELFSPLTEVEVVDERTVRFRTGHPWPILPVMLSLQEIASASLAEEGGWQVWAAQPVGTGPFRYLSAEPGRTVRLLRYDEYRDADANRAPEGAVMAGKLTFEVVPQMVDQIAMLKSGQADVIFNVPPEMLGVLEHTPGLCAVSHGSTRSRFAEINCEQPPFYDRRVRQALNYAVDMEAVVKSVAAGHGRVMATVLSDEAFGFAPELKPYPYDPFMARRLLDDAKFPARRIIRVRCHHEERAFAGAIVLFLSKVGLKTQLTVTDEYRPATLGGRADWDIFVGSWGNTTLDPSGILVPKFKSFGRGNLSMYNNPELDRLMDAAERTEDPEARAEAWRRVQREIFTDAPMIFGFGSDEFYGLRTRVKGFSPPPGGLFDFKSVVVADGE